MILRNYMYLDTEILTDYLATLEGFVSSDQFDQTETETRDLKANAGYKIIEGGLATEKSKSTRQSFAITEAAKFQKLYEILEKQDMFKFLDLFDQQSWDLIRRGDLLEIEAKVRLPYFFSVMQVFDNVSPLINIMDQDGLNLPNVKRDEIDGLTAISEYFSNKSLPVMFEALLTPGYSFFSNLQRRYLKCQVSEIEGEVTIFGKVQRVFRKGEKAEVFNIFPAISPMLPKMNREQAKKIQQSLCQDKLAEYVKGPAIAMSILSIYR